jgi:alpha-galactosidase
MKSFVPSFPLLLWLSNHLLPSSLAYDNGLGRTPPMGWNSWNHFHCNIEEQLIRDTAQAMIDLGLKDVGYNYVNLDDCWQLYRNSTGSIVADATKFPTGIRALADHVHSLGLLFGLYSDAGIKTCQGRPGGLWHEQQDAASYKEFDVDYLKYDNCFNLDINVHTRYQAMHDALNASGHAIFFSMCEWGQEDPATWAMSVGNSWRTTGDIYPTWKSITNILDANDKWHSYAGPGGWNDPDMLEVGNGDLTIAEQRSHFTLWALMKAPLLLGNDLQSITNDTLEIITNTDIIALNQDPMGVQGYKRMSLNGLEVWAGPLDQDNVAVVLFNRADQPANITAKWDDIGIDSGSKVMQVLDLWMHKSLGVRVGNVTAMVDSHDVVALRLSPAFVEEPLKYR